jgi:tRNA threonylcarbamoyladenosine biosynthesis protein TsaB
MKLLAIDTATELCSAALLIEGEMRSREIETDRGAAEHILPMIDSLLSESGVSLRALDAIAFGRGPGGFTGVRLAASVTQGLAFAAGLPVVPISDLASVARRALDLDPTVGRVLVCNDARMQEVYWAYFSRDADGSPVLDGEERVGPASSVTSSAIPALGAGRGFRAYPELQSRVFRSEDNLLPRALEIARLAVLQPRLPPEQAIPIYVRDEVVRATS